MKKILLTLAKWFHVDLTVEKYVEVPKIEYKERIVALDGHVDGDVTVHGSLIVEGTLKATGAIICLEKGE